MAPLQHLCAPLPRSHTYRGPLIQRPPPPPYTVTPFLFTPNLPLPRTLECIHPSTQANYRVSKLGTKYSIPKPGSRGRYDDDAAQP